MATMTLASVPARIAATSQWSGYESGYGEVRYTNATTDGGIAVFDLSALQGASIYKAHLIYSLHSNSGTRRVRFAGTAVNADDASILEKLQRGETSLRLHFTFRASGASGGEGEHTAHCTWSEIALEIEYTPSGGIEGEATFESGKLRYFTNRASARRGETVLFTLRPEGIEDLQGVYLHLDGGNEALFDEAQAAVGSDVFIRLPVTIQNAAWDGRFAPAHIRFTLLCAEGEKTGGRVETALKLVTDYRAPLITCAWSDDSDVFERFGHFVRLKSLLRCSCVYTLDTDADSAVCVTGRSLVLNGQEYTSGTDEFVPGEISGWGEVPFTLSVTDSHGLTSSISGTIDVLHYASPGLSTLKFERYKTTIGESGQEVYEPDDGSQCIRVSLSGSVSALNGLNNWTLTAAYTNGSSSGTRTLLTGSDGQALNLDGDKNVFDPLLSEQHVWQVLVTLSDCFESVQYELFLPKAEAIFNIERGGVAVGMRSGGSRAQPKFEVAYPAEFYGEVTFSGMDSGWQDVPLENAAPFDMVAGVKIRRLGELVFLRGSIVLNSALSSGAGGSSAGVKKIGTLQERFWPPCPMAFAIVPDRSQCYLNLVVDTDGSLTLYNRCGYQVGTSAEIALNLSYMCA